MNCCSDQNQKQKQCQYMHVYAYNKCWWDFDSHHRCSLTVRFVLLCSFIFSSILLLHWNKCHQPNYNCCIVCNHSVWSCRNEIKWKRKRETTNKIIACNAYHQLSDVLRTAVLKTVNFGNLHTHILSLEYHIICCHIPPHINNSIALCLWLFFWVHCYKKNICMHKYRLVTSINRRKNNMFEKFQWLLH